jgi:hypothetical protein
MRKIEAQMNDAILANKNWEKDNTQVIYYNDTQESEIYLYGHHIATVGDNYVELFSRGHKTATTKSRLNAILREHCIAGECIFQRNFEWFVHKLAGYAGSSPVFVEKEFEEGFVFS